MWEWCCDMTENTIESRGSTTKKTHKILVQATHDQQSNGFCSSFSSSLFNFVIHNVQACVRFKRPRLTLKDALVLCVRVLSMFVKKSGYVLEFFAATVMISDQETDGCKRTKCVCVCLAHKRQPQDRRRTTRSFLHVNASQRPLCSKQCIS